MADFVLRLLFVPRSNCTRKCFGLVQDADRKAREYFPGCKVRQVLWHESMGDLHRRCFDAGATGGEVHDAIGSIFREGGSRATKDDLIELYMKLKSRAEETDDRIEGVGNDRAGPKNNGSNGDVDPVRDKKTTVKRNDRLCESRKVKQRRQL